MSFTVVPAASAFIATVCCNIYSV